MRYRKKPVVIEAHCFDPNQSEPMPKWLSSALRIGRVFYQGGENPYMTIPTLEGNMVANVGDWIIQGVQGELYPCKPDIFEATYEPVTETAT